MSKYLETVGGKNSLSTGRKLQQSQVHRGTARIFCHHKYRPLKTMLVSLFLEKYDVGTFSTSYFSVFLIRAWCQQISISNVNLSITSNLSPFNPRCTQGSFCLDDPYFLYLFIFSAGLLVCDSNSHPGSQGRQQHPFILPLPPQTQQRRAQTCELSRQSTPVATYI